MKQKMKFETLCACPFSRSVWLKVTTAWGPGIQPFGPADQLLTWCTSGEPGLRNTEYKGSACSHVPHNVRVVETPERHRLRQRQSQ